MPSFSVTMNVDCKTALALDDGLGCGDRPQQLVADLLAGMNEGQAIQSSGGSLGSSPIAVGYFDA